MEQESTFPSRYLRWWAPVLAPTAIRLLDLVEDVSGRRIGSVVDVGTGTGTLAIASSTRWPDATVAGVDPDADMLAVARSQAEGNLRSRGGATFLCARAEALPLADASVDAFVSSFAFQYVDRATAYQEAARVLRPGGVVTIVTWLGPKPHYAPRDAFNESVMELGLRASDPRSPGRDADGLQSPSAAAAELERAGLFALRADVQPLGYRFDPESFLGWKEHLDQRELFDGLDLSRRERLVARLRSRFSQLRPEDFVIPDPVVYVTGRR